MRYPTPNYASICLIGAVLLTTPTRATAAEIAPSDRPELPPLELGDEAEPLDPSKSRTPEEDDRLEALALFSAGRMAEQKEDLATALKLFQRAHRRDPQSVSILQAVLQVAFEIDRFPEAVRYARILAELDPSDPSMIRRLAVHLASEGEFEAAVAMYQRALDAMSDRKGSVAHHRLALEAAKLFFLAEHYEDAAKMLGPIFEAVDTPDESGLSESQRKSLLDDADRTYELFGSAFLAVDDFDRAERAFRRSYEYSEDDGRLALHLAQLNQARGRNEAVVEGLTTYLQEHAAAADRDTFRLLRDALDEVGRPGDLEEILLSAASDAEENPAIALTQAEYYLAQSDREKAVSQFRAALRLAEGRRRDPDGIVRATYRGLFGIVLEEGDAPATLDFLIEVVERFGSLDPVESSIDALTEKAELFDEVVALAASRIGDEVDSPLDYDGALAIATLLTSDDRYEAAEPFFEAAIDADPEQSDYVMRLWGFGLLIDEQYEDAQRVFERAIETSAAKERVAEFHYHLAGVLEMLDRTDEALAASRAAVEVAEENRAAYGDQIHQFRSRLPWILYHARRSDEAEQEYERMLDELKADYSTSAVRDLVRESRLMLSNLAVRRDAIAEAEEHLEDILDEYPRDVSALNDLGYLWADQNKFLNRAERMISRAVGQDPDNAAYHDSLGWVRYRLGDFSAAVDALKHATELEEPDPVILDHLGDAYRANGQSEAAVETWDRAAELFEEAGEADSAAAVRRKISESEAK